MSRPLEPTEEALATAMGAALAPVYEAASKEGRQPTEIELFRATYAIIRDQVLEEAAKACDVRDFGDGIADSCAAAIRALKGG